MVNAAYSRSTETVISGQLMISQGPLPNSTNIFYEERGKVKKNERPGKLANSC